MPAPPQPLEDNHGHLISYLRVSVTDRCNERCQYCMPKEDQEWLPREEVLTYEEILRVIQVAAGLGVSKLRITGGEPLARRGVSGFIQQAAAIPGIRETGVSTNGTLLSAETFPGSGQSIASSLAESGVTSLNVSLDTLDRNEYALTAGRDFLDRALVGIDAALDAGLHVKMNTVLTRPFGLERMRTLLEYAAERSVIPRFIELMPVSTVDVLHERNFLSLRDARKLAEDVVGPLTEEQGAPRRGNGPALYFRSARGQVIGFIGAMTDPHFCGRCNKLRLTCDGKLRPCLGSWLEFDLRAPLRSGVSDQALAAIIRGVVDQKPKDHDFARDWKPGRPMVAIGG